MTLQRLVRVPRDLDSVIDVAKSEVDPVSVGSSKRDVDALWSAVVDLYATGTQPAVSMCLMRKGEVVLERAIGHHSGNAPGDPRDGDKRVIRHDTPFCLFSASKAVTAMMIHLLDDRGLLHIDDRVVEYIPEFGRHGKESTTIRHVLTHRAGIPSVAGEHNDLELLTQWDRIVELLCDARPVWKAGRRLGYHAITGGFILGEIVRRVTGKDLRAFFEEEIKRPLGFEWFQYGVPKEKVGEVAQNAFTGLPVPPGISHLIQRALGVPIEDAVRLSNDERFLTAIVPAGNMVATAREAATFFELLRRGGRLGKTRIFDARTVRRAVGESSWLEVDLTLVLPIRYSLGFILGSEVVSLYGPDTPNAFGHLGFINVLCWADPERELSAALLTSGKPFVGSHLGAMVRLLSTISRRFPKTHLGH